ncbi:hypothetical protein ACFQVA_03430 [Actinomadura keratinilytica]
MPESTHTLPSAGAFPADPAGLLALDQRHVWHPYGPMPGSSDPLVVDSASGVRLRLAEPVEGWRSWSTACRPGGRRCTGTGTRCWTRRSATSWGG